MKTHKMTTLCGMALAAAVAQSALGVMTTVPATSDMSSPFIVGNYTSFQVTGADMAERLKITATFFDFATGGSVTESATWQLSGAPDGGEALGTFWSMSQSGDTSFSPWRLDVPGGAAAPTMMIQSIRMEFDNSNTLDGAVFDRFNGITGTPGTATGQDYLVTDNSLFLDNMVAVPHYTLPADNPNDSVPGAFGDSFAVIDINFDGFSTPPSGYFIEFVQDTDLVVPTPGAAGLMGLAGIALVRRRRCA